MRLKWEGAPSLPGAINYTGMPSGSRVQDEMINIVFQIKKFMDLKEHTKVQMEEIDLILEELKQEPGCENYGKVLKL